MDAATLNDRGVELEKAGNLLAAFDSYLLALEMDPDNVPALTNMMQVAYIQQGIRLAKLIVSRLVTLSPGNKLALEIGAKVYMEEGRPDIATQLYTAAGLYYEAAFAELHCEVSSPVLQNVHSRLGMRFVPAKHQPCPPMQWDGQRKLRVGYLFPASWTMLPFFLPTLREHRNVDATVFWEGGIDSEVRRSLADVTSHVFCTGQDSDAEMLEITRNLKLDVFVNLRIGRLGLHWMNPAPLQYSMIGYPHWIGVPGVKHVTAPWAFQRGTLPNPDAYRGCEFIFGCLQRAAKLSPTFLKSVGQIMQACPSAKLRLLSYGGKGNTGLVEHVGKFGVPVDRVEWIQPCDRHTYLEAVAGCQLILDSFPYSGTTTTCEALAMGIPVVTLEGRDTRSRVTADILRQIGLNGLVAKNTSEFAHTAQTFYENRSVVPSEMLRTAVIEKLNGREAAAALEAMYCRDAAALCC